MRICFMCGEIAATVKGCPEVPPPGANACPFSKWNRGIPWAKKARAEIRAGKHRGIYCGLTKCQAAALAGDEANPL